MRTNFSMWLGPLFLLIVRAGRNGRWMQRWHRETAPELADLNPDQQAV